MAGRSPRLLLLYPGALYAKGAFATHLVKTNLAEMLSFLRARGVDADVLDLQVELGNPAPDEVDEFLSRGRERLLSRDFDVLGISCWTSFEYLATVDLAEAVRAERPRALIVVGGYHPTARPGDFTYAGAPFDVVVTGDGELALLELLTGGPTRGAAGPPRVVDGVPLPMDQVRCDFEGYPYLRRGAHQLGVFLSRGCPYRCAFCMDPVAGRTRWRHHGVERAVEIVEQARSYDPQRVIIYDACFAYLASWRREFLQALVDRGFDTPLLCEMRGDRLSAGDIELCRKLDFWLQFGVETMSPRMAEIMRKAKNGERYVGDVDRTLEEVNRQGVLAKVFLLLNHPGETPETAEETAAYFERFVAGHDRLSVIVNTSRFHYYVGTDTDLRREHYEREYGAEFAHTGWYRERRPQFEISRQQRASRELADVMPYVDRILALQPQIVRKMPARQQLLFLHQLGAAG